MSQSSVVNSKGHTLVLGSTGKTGARVLAGLIAKGVSVRRGSRSASPAFDWTDDFTWDACLQNVDTVYISYSPDLAIPGATESVRLLVKKCQQQNIKRLVLLSGRGEAEAQACEKIVMDSGISWTIIRSSWFNQNFSEGDFSELVSVGQITLPGGDMSEPFVDIDDLAEVAIAALTETGHEQEVYEVTGPELLTFTDIATELSDATGRNIAYIDVPHDEFIRGIKQSGAPEDVVWILDYLFATVLDGRNQYLADGIQRALGRPPTSFAEFAKRVAATGVWDARLQSEKMGTE